mmetsp:Transcript_114095/g.317433  ORF Transcript_114095/g.317433 Transcript_114095/m.317433 type:complete len:299 (+) Transcript_114095:73-969(+)
MALATGLAITAVTTGAALGQACSAQLHEFFDAAEFSDEEEEVTQQAGAQTAPTEGDEARRREPPSELTGEAASAGGFSMEEARRRADEAHSQVLKMSPREVLAELQRGNARFWMGSASRPEASAFDRRALISKQFPTVAVLSCADSRVPPELIFDQGLGSIFVVRVAGNCLATTTTASLQYAVHHLKVKVLVVLGHELCGAIKAAQLPIEQLQQEPKELSEALLGLKQGLDQGRFKSLEDSRALDREAVTTNVKKQVEALTKDEGIMAKVNSKELLMVGGFYEISSGIVDFFSEVAAK